MEGVNQRTPAFRGDDDVRRCGWQYRVWYVRRKHWFRIFLPALTL